MNFVFPRDRVVASTSGHVIGFKKGVAQHVPPEARKEVIAAGGVPEDEAYDITDDSKPPKADVVQPTDPDERQKAVFEVFAELVKRGKREDFTANGMPHSKVMHAELGWELPAQERDVLWVEFQKVKKD